MTTSDTETVVITIHTYGKAGRYGPDVYKVARGADERQLTAVGWLPVWTGDIYVYMRAPLGRGARRVPVSITVPTQAAVLVLAQRLHSGGVAWQGDVCGWRAAYTPRRAGTQLVQVISSEGDTRQELHQYDRPASFSIGESSVWQQYAQWDNGPDSPPRWGCFPDLLERWP